MGFGFARGGGIFGNAIPVEVATITRARFTAQQTMWTIDGTSTVAGDTLTISLDDPAPKNELGTVGVNAIGNWSFRVRNSDVAAAQDDTVTAVSSSGLTVTASVEVK